MARTLITGANGLTGRRLAAALRHHHEVIALVQTMPGAPLEGIDYRVVDLGAPWDSSILPNSMDAVFHLAQPGDSTSFPASAISAFWVNTGSVATLLDYAHRANARNFILVSTGGLYGTRRHDIFEESPIDTPPGPLNHYFRTKLCAEVLALAYRSCFALTVVRPFFIYGPSQPKNRLIQRIAQAVQDQTPIRIVGKNGTEMNPVYVDDVVTGLVASMAPDALPLINFAGPQVVSIRDIAAAIGTLLKRPPSFHELDGEADRFVADVRLFQRLVKRPLISFDVGIQATLNNVQGAYV